MATAILEHYLTVVFRFLQARRDTRESFPFPPKWLEPKDEDPTPSPLLIAAGLGDIHAAERFLRDVDVVHPHFGTPLMMACSQNHASMVEFLLRNGASVDVEGGIPGSAIATAAWEQNSILTGLLLEHGADPNFGRYMGGTALEHAVRKANVTIVQQLLDHGADPWYEGRKSGFSYATSAFDVVEKAMAEALSNDLTKRVNDLGIIRDFLRSRIKSEEYRDACRTQKS